MKNAYELDKKILMIIEQSHCDQTDKSDIHKILENFEKIQKLQCQNDKCLKNNSVVKRIGFHPLVQCCTCTKIYKMI